MPGISWTDHAEKFISDLERCGANVLITSSNQYRPLTCRVTLGGFKCDLEVYLWTITPGGKGRGRPSERRIQLTGVDHIDLKPGVQTLLGGWSEEAGVYAFWDVCRHLGFTAGSSSLQVDQMTLESAYHHGFSAEARIVREGEELAIGIQSDYLFWYLIEWERIYECGPEIENAPVLVDAPVEEEREYVDSGSDDPTKSRRHKVVSVIQHFRDARFRPTVLRAYGFRCCVTGVALRLVDAAHILPVSDPTSTDEVSNGLALCANHHRAYDGGLLGILPGGRLATNPRTEQRLKQDGLASGIADYKSMLPRHIRLPPSTDLAPSDDNLHKGLLLRGWTDSEIEFAMRS